jgi:hypothetical protein
MDMIGHYAPTKKLVALSIEELEGTFHQIGNFGPAHPTLSVAGIQKPLDAFREESL